MDRKVFMLFLCVSVTFCVGASAFAQESSNARPKAYSAVRPLWGVDEGTVKEAITAGSGSGMIPMWTFNVTSTRDGNPYSGVMVGQSAFTAPNSKTTIPTQIIPVIFVMADGGVFDPTAPDPLCWRALGGHTGRRVAHCFQHSFRLERR